jgi:hypothetical protein
MNRIMLASAALFFAGGAAHAGAAPAPEATEVRVRGCVEAGVEASCLIVKDVKSGKLYHVMFKESRPAIGTGIEFTGEPFDGVSACMQGANVTVTKWARSDSLKCTKGEAPKPQ